MSTMLSVFGPTLALYMFGLIFYTAVETARSLIGSQPTKSLGDATKDFDLAA